MRVLITGGAGFIGRHTARAFLDAGHSVGIVDCLIPQVHPQRPNMPDFVRGLVDEFGTDGRGTFWTYFCDVRDSRLSGLPWVLDDFKPDAVLHLAAEVGVGQGEVEIARYTSCNVFGTANLIDQLLRMTEPVKHLVVAGSMSVLGERAGLGPAGDGERANPPNLYAWTKLAQEQLVAQASRRFEPTTRTTVARFFNVYGEGQQLSNPYTGIAAIFACAFLNNQEPVIFGDGSATRDFIHVQDVASALLFIVENRVQGNVNVGTGVATSVLDMANTLKASLVNGGLEACAGVEIRPSGFLRRGDINHCVSDRVQSLLRVLGWSPGVPLQDGIARYTDWLLGEARAGRIPSSNAGLALSELNAAGVLVDTTPDPGEQAVS